jgi:hypothetical protein
LLLIPTLEAHLAELGIDACDFGGSVIRKILQLADRNGFILPLSSGVLLALVDRALNAYCLTSRPVHVARSFTAQETTRGERELSIEGEVFLGQ